MKGLPLVSIVTPSLNQGEFLESTISSVVEQDYPNIEYIVCDGGSTDGSVDIIRNYEDRLAYWVSENDHGQSNAINKGWKIATGEICAYLNSDDNLEPGAVRVAVEAFQSNPQAGIVYGNCDYINECSQKIGIYRGAQADFKRLLCNGQGPYIAQPASFFRASLVCRVGFLDEMLQLSMDYDLFLRLARESEIVYVPSTLASFRIHDSSKSSTLKEAHIRESSLVRARYGGRYLIKPHLQYYRYRLLCAVPKFGQTLFRRWRDSPKDYVYLQSEKIRKK